MKKRKYTVLRLLGVLLCLGVLGITALGVINAGVKLGARPRILSSREAAELEDVDCILVLGCLVHESGRPSDMLRDRLDRSLELYDLGAAPKLLMSGDHGREHYDEVAAMKRYALDHGVPTQDIFMDHAGFSTYESLYRARDVFQAQKVIIVSQEYHLYRALHIARELGLEAWGVGADLHTYVGQATREAREILARAKDWAVCLFQPLPTYLGDPIPITGSGESTHDTAADLT